MHNRLLSICMPTNNRVGSLKDALPDLISKIKKYNIKIYIHDNNSQDETEEYITQLQQEYPYIEYYKSDIYRESDRNMQKALEMSDTEFRLLLGDHYILYDEQSIDTIYHFLKKNPNLDALVLRYKGRKMFQQSDYIYSDQEEFLKELGWYIGMAATTIYNRKMVENMNFSLYYNTNFTQSLALLEYISKREFSIGYIAQELVWSTKEGIKGKGSWHDRTLEIFAHDWYKGVHSLPDSYSKKSKLEAIKNHTRMTTGFYSWNSLILYRYANGITLFKLLKYGKYLRITGGNFVLFKSIAVACVPRRVIPYFFKDAYAYIQRILGNTH